LQVNLHMSTNNAGPQDKASQTAEKLGLPHISTAVQGHRAVFAESMGFSNTPDYSQLLCSEEGHCGPGQSW
jgi:hypothetical protein